MKGVEEAGGGQMELSKAVVSTGVELQPDTRGQVDGGALKCELHRGVLLRQEASLCDLVSASHCSGLPPGVEVVTPLWKKAIFWRRGLLGIIRSQPLLIHSSLG